MDNNILTMSLAAIFAAGTAQAVQIDDFDGGPQSVSAPGSDTVAYAGAIGGSRTVSISSVGPLGAAAAVIAPPGIYSHSADALTSATSMITWDANGAGLGGVDLVDGMINNVFNFDILSIDQGDITLTLTVDGVSQDLVGVGVGTQSVPFADFAGVDFTSVDFISLTVVGGEASDLTLDLLNTSGDPDIPPPVVPAPATLFLIGLGLAGLGYQRRKIKAA